MEEELGEVNLNFEDSAEEAEEIGENNIKQRVGQEQIEGLLFSDKLSWQAIIYDLINSEQLDPWDLDLSVLAQKYLEKIRALEEANFFVSSKVLLAAAFLLRIKSEILLNRELRSLDDILFGKKEQKKYVQERLELEEDVPGLVPRTPLPRFKKVSLQELMAALGKAITTENRRIKRVVLARQAEFEASIVMPKKTINIQDQIKGVYQKLLEIFSNRETKYAFSDLAGDSVESRVSTFIPLLHLDNQQKVWLEQDGHFEEIWILLKHLYEKQNADTLAQMRKEVEEEIERSAAEAGINEEEEEMAEKLENEFKNPLGEAIEKAEESEED